jgi:hypothetical protein
MSSATDSGSITSTTTSQTLNSKKKVKQNSQLSERAIGLICAVALVTLAIISLTGYLLRAKCIKRLAFCNLSYFDNYYQLVIIQF